MAVTALQQLLSLIKEECRTWLLIRLDRDTHNSSFTWPRTKSTNEPRSRPPLYLVPVRSEGVNLRACQSNRAITQPQRHSQLQSGVPSHAIRVAHILVLGTVHLGDLQRAGRRELAGQALPRGREALAVATPPADPPSHLPHQALVPDQLTERRT
jgi:hypothetical protein